MARPLYCSSNTMSTLNVKIPDEMEDDIEAYIDAHPHYLNKSELVRDAVRHMLVQPPLAEWAEEDIEVSREQVGRGETVALEDLE